jgi:hypothetical protein
MVELQKEN